MSCTQDLGTFTVCDKETQLDFKSDVSAGLIGTDGSGEASRHPGSLLPRGSWISGIHRISLGIVYLWHGKPVNTSSSDFSWLLRQETALLQADIWRRCGFLVTPRLAEATQGASGSIALDLVIDPELPIELRIADHGLPVDISRHSVNPPPDVPHYRLSTVCIVIDIRRTTPGIGVQVTAMQDDEDNRQPSTDARRQSISDSDERSARLAGRRLSRAPRVLEHPSAISQERMNTLTQYVILLSISRSPRSLRNTKLLSDARTQTLEEIAPLIWKTGYCAAVAHRACLLPSLKHSIARLKTRVTATSALWTHLSEIETNTAPISTSAASSSLRVPKENGATSPVDKLLWQNLYQMDHDPKVASKASRDIPPTSSVAPSLGNSIEERLQVQDDGPVLHHVLENYEMLEAPHEEGDIDQALYNDTEACIHLSCVPDDCLESGSTGFQPDVGTFESSFWSDSQLGREDILDEYNLKSDSILMWNAHDDSQDDHDADESLIDAAAACSHGRRPPVASFSDLIVDSSFDTPLMHRSASQLSVSSQKLNSLDLYETPEILSEPHVLGQGHPADRSQSYYLSSVSDWVCDTTRDYADPNQTDQKNARRLTLHESQVNASQIATSSISDSSDLSMS